MVTEELVYDLETWKSGGQTLNEREGAHSDAATSITKTPPSSKLLEM